MEKIIRFFGISLISFSMLFLGMVLFLVFFSDDSSVKISAFYYIFLILLLAIGMWLVKNSSKIK